MDSGTLGLYWENDRPRRGGENRMIEVEYFKGKPERVFWTRQDKRHKDEIIDQFLAINEGWA